jgi:hypothetical protein
VLSIHCLNIFHFALHSVARIGIPVTIPEFLFSRDLRPQSELEFTALELESRRSGDPQEVPGHVERHPHRAASLRHPQPKMSKRRK